MLDQLKELLEMQKVLDESIFKEKGITEYPLKNMKIALFVELGELMNEFPTKFKHWKSTAVDNREKGLEEYIDVFHFLLSIANYATEEDFVYLVSKYNDKYILKEKEESFDYILESITFDDLPAQFDYFFVLGNKLGFSWEEIYNAYKKKNSINYERLKKGY